MRIIGLLFLYILLPITLLLWYLNNDEVPQLTEIPYVLPEGVLLKNSKMYHKVDQPLRFALTQSPRKLMLHFVAVTTSNISKHKTFDFKLSLNITCPNEDITDSLSFQVNKENEASFSGSNHKLPTRFLEKRDNQILFVSQLSRVHYELPENCSSVQLDVLDKSSFIDFVGFQVYQQVLRSTRVEPLDIWQRLSESQKADLTNNFPFDLSYLSDEEKSNLAKFRWQPLIPDGNDEMNYKIINYYAIQKEFILDQNINDKAYPHLSDEYKTITFPITEAGKYYFHAEHSLSERDWELRIKHYNLTDTPTLDKTIPFSESNVKHPLTLSPGLVTFNTSIPAHIALYSETVQFEDHEHYAPTFLVKENSKITFNVKHSSTALTPFKINIRSISNIDTHSKLPNSAVIEIFNGNKSVNRFITPLSTETETHRQLSGYEFSQWLSKAAESYLYLEKNVTHVTISTPTPILVSASTRIPDKPGYRYLPEQRRDWFDFEEAIPDWFGVQPVNFETFVETGAVQMLHLYHRSIFDQNKTDLELEYVSLLSDNQKINPALIIEEAIIEEQINVGSTASLTTENNNHFYKLTNNELVINSEQLPKNYRLFFYKNDKQPKPVSWKFNDKPQPPFYIAGSWGLVDLTNILPEESGHISIAKNDVAWFVNQASQINVFTHLKKKQIIKLPKFSKKDLTITKKQAKELLLFTILSEEKHNTQRVDLEIEIIPQTRIKPFNTAATIKKMHYSLQMTPTSMAVKLSSDIQFYSQQNFVYSMLEDIQSDTFTLRIKSKSNKDVYLAVSQQTLSNDEQINRYRYDQTH